MLSEEDHWCLRLYFHIGERFHASPLRCTPASKLCPSSPPPPVYVDGRPLQLPSSPSPSSDSFTPSLYHLRVLCHLSFFATGHLASWSNAHEFAAFWTKFLQFDRRYSSQDFNGTRADKIGLMFKCLTVIGYTHIAFLGAVFLAIRKNPTFIYSMIWERIIRLTHTKA